MMGFAAATVNGEIVYCARCCTKPITPYTIVSGNYVMCVFRATYSVPSGPATPSEWSLLGSGLTVATVAWLLVAMSF